MFKTLRTYEIDKWASCDAHLIETMAVLQDILVVSYALVELFLHLIEHFLRGVYLSLFSSVSLITRVLLCCVVFLSDIQQARPQFLQLTAGDAHQSSV
jgi:hypothetical protein